MVFNDIIARTLCNQKMWRRDNYNASEAAYEDISLQSYVGPYDHRTLHNATENLRYYVNNQDTVNWRRIAKKTGLFERNPHDIFGQHSSYFSQADLPGNRESETYTGRRYSEDTSDESNCKEQDNAQTEPAGSSSVSKPSKPSATVTCENGGDLFVLDYKGTPVETESSKSLSTKTSIEQSTSKKNVESSSPDANGNTALDRIDNGSKPCDVENNLQSEYIVIDSLEDSTVELEADKSSYPTTSSLRTSSDARNNNDFTTSNAIERQKRTFETEARDIKIGAKKAKTNVTHNVNQSNLSGVVETVNNNLMHSAGSSRDSPIVLENDSSFSSLSNDYSEGTGEKHAYQCDYCDFVSEKPSVTTAHLHKEKHASCSHVMTDFQGNVTSMDSPNFTFLKTYLWQKKVLMCGQESCTTLFDNLTLCQSHLSVSHPAIASPSYAVGNVVNQSDFEINCKSFQCSQCQMRLSKLKAVRKHFQAFDHYPFPRLPNTMLFFLCKSCNNVFYSFEKVFHHMKVKHGSESQDGLHIASAFQVSTDLEIHPCLPFSRDRQGELASIRNRLQGIKAMYKHTTNHKKKINLKRALKDMKRGIFHDTIDPRKW